MSMNISNSIRPHRGDSVIRLRRGELTVGWPSFERARSGGLLRRKGCFTVKSVERYRLQGAGAAGAIGVGGQAAIHLGGEVARADGHFALTPGGQDRQEATNRSHGAIVGADQGCARTGLGQSARRRAQSSQDAKIGGTGVPQSRGTRQTSGLPDAITDRPCGHRANDQSPAADYNRPEHQDGRE